MSSGAIEIGFRMVHNDLFLAVARLLRKQGTTYVRLMHFVSTSATVLPAATSERLPSYRKQLSDRFEQNDEYHHLNLTRRGTHLLTL